VWKLVVSLLVLVASAVVCLPTQAHAKCVCSGSSFYSRGAYAPVYEFFEGVSNDFDFQVTLEVYVPQDPNKAWDAHCGCSPSGGGGRDCGIAYTEILQPAGYVQLSSDDKCDWEYWWMPGQPGIWVCTNTSCS
jgi:hypothetical protein